MLFSPFTSPRRLVLLAVFVFIVVLFFVRSSEYSEYLPKYDIPGFTHDAPTEEGEQQEQQPPSATPPEVSEPQAVDPEPIESNYEWVPEPSPTPSPTSTPESTSASLATHSPSPTLAPVSNTSSEHVAAKPLPHRTYQQIQAMIKDLIQWVPLNTPDHWPPWDGYANMNYDPNRWEGFDWENRYYTTNGIKTLRAQKPTSPEPYQPYPDYNSREWMKQWKGKHVACEGARGKVLNESREDMVMAYPSMPEDFPPVVVGDASVVGLDTGHCFDRYHRYGPYGYGQAEREYVNDWTRPIEKPDWSSVKWAQLQDNCLISNQNRYKPHARLPVDAAPGKDLDKIKKPEQDKGEKGPQYHPRTALLIRTWEGYSYTENDLQAIRALITELSLLSGGEYQVYLFVNVKDKNADIFGNQQVYDDVLRAAVPRELRDISILWNEQICEEWYPKVGDWQVYWSQFMPLQWFMKTHPEFDFVWNWETDARYTGNHYNFLEQVTNFARKFPRKHMWERNSRFYFPSAHGSYEQWLNDTDKTIAEAAKKGTLEPVWGPKPYNHTRQKPLLGPQPPHPQDKDDYQWGVGEEADLITLQPIWDPTKTEWTFRHKIWDFVPGLSPKMTAENPLADGFYHPDFEQIPRRTYINTLSRFSRTLLDAMHQENRAGRNMQAEMWPATVALHHGLKAVYAPHPIWTDRVWPAWYLDAVFNADGGEAAQWGQRKDSVYNHDREANFRGWSWYYQTGFPKTLYRRWLGWKADAGPLGDVGGKDFEEMGVFMGLTPEDRVAQQVGGNGRMCLPGMLLHPVKKVVENEEEME